MKDNLFDHKSEYQPALDGIRGLAIILVIVSHFFFNIGIFKAGWIGVDLFFVLSGYLIASKFIRSPLSVKLVRTFFRNRVLRILPLYFLFLAVIFGIWLLLPMNKREYLYLPNINFYWQLHVVLMQNWMYVFSNTDSGSYSPIFHLWSIAVEEQFYILFPFLILLISKVRTGAWFLIAAIICIAVLRSIDYSFYHSANHTFRYYCNTFYRLDTFLAGILLAVMLRDIKDPIRLYRYFTAVFILCLGLYVGTSLWYNSVSNDTPFINTFGYSIIAFMFMTLIYFTVMKRSALLNKIFTSRFLVFSGKISYGLYIFHFAIDFFSFSLMHKYFSFLFTLFNQRTAVLVFTFIMIAFLYLVSYMSYVYFESYFLKMKKRYA